MTFHFYLSVFLLLEINISLSKNTLKMFQIPSNYNDAYCLDGTTAAYYLEGSGKNEWFIYFEGGGWCYNAEQCFLRSRTHLGSSIDFPPELNLENEHNYFSRSQERNIFYNWNMIYIRYCDGGSFAGDTVGILNNSKLYYKGSQILQSFLKDVGVRHDMRSASKIVVSGSSAGALSAILHVDKFRRAFSQSNVVALPDSGFFLPIDIQSCSEPYNTSMYNLFHLMNASAGVPTACTADRLGHKCLFAFHSLKYVKSPIFALQSAVDVWEIPHILCIPLKSKRFTEIESFREAFQKQFLIAFDHSIPLENDDRYHYHSGLLDFCPHHGNCDINCNKDFKDFWNFLRDGYGHTQQELFKLWYHKILASSVWKKSNNSRKVFNNISSSTSKTVDANPSTSSKSGAVHVQIYRGNFPTYSHCGVYNSEYASIYG